MSVPHRPPYDPVKAELERVREALRVAIRHARIHTGPAAPRDPTECPSCGPVIRAAIEEATCARTD